jgi:hypothetical protein
MRVINPNFAKPVNPLAQYQDQLKTFFENNTGKESITFDQIRAALNKTAAQLPDGMIHSQLQEWGYEVAL